MSEPLIWIHGDCLNPHSPVLKRWPKARRIFVFDDTTLDGNEVSFKRIVFQYESLLEIEGIEIQRGKTVPILLSAALESGASCIATIESVSPGFGQTVQSLKREGSVTVELVPPSPFVSLTREEEARLDLKRFSRFWQSVKKRALEVDAI